MSDHSKKLGEYDSLHELMIAHEKLQHELKSTREQLEQTEKERKAFKEGFEVLMNDYIRVQKQKDIARESLSSLQVSSDILKKALERISGTPPGIFSGKDIHGPDSGSIFALASAWRIEQAKEALTKLNTPMPMGEDKVIKKPSIEKLEVSRKRLKELYEKEPSEELLVILEDAFKDEAQPEEG